MLSRKAEGEAALSALDRAIAHKPGRDAEAFSAATEHLCRLRARLIADQHSHLGRVNAVISAALAGQFPLGESPFPVIAAAAEDLRSLLADMTD